MTLLFLVPKCLYNILFESIFKSEIAVPLDLTAEL